MLHDSVDTPTALFQRIQVGVMGNAFRPRGTEEVIGHQVDAIQTCFNQRFHVGVIKGLHDRGAGDGDFHIAQAGGIQLLTQFANKQRIVFTIFRAARVASAFGVRVFPIDIHFAEHRELFEQFHHAFSKGFTCGIRRCSFMEAVTHGPAADAHGQHQVMALLFGFRLQIAQTAKQTFTIFLSHGLRINIPAANAMSNVDVRLEITPWIKESRFVLNFTALFRAFSHDVTILAIIFMETGHANEAENNFIVSSR